MFGINSFYYTEIIKFKRNMRNSLLLYLRQENDENIITSISDLAPLFLVDHDNIDKEFYNEEELKQVNALFDLYYKDINKTISLNKNDANQLIHLAMNKRLTINQNEPLAIKLAEKYNSLCNNELLLIHMDVFKEVCQSIDYKENE